MLQKMTREKQARRLQILFQGCTRLRQQKNKKEGEEKGDFQEEVKNQLNLSQECVMCKEMKKSTIKSRFLA